MRKIEKNGSCASKNSVLRWGTKKKKDTGEEEYGYFHDWY